MIDKRNGIIHLKEPFKPFWVIALPYYGGHIVSKAARREGRRQLHHEIPAQCGPYLLRQVGAEAEGDADRQPGLAGAEAGLLDKVEIYIVTDDQAAQLAYEADAFDYTRIARVGGQGGEGAACRRAPTSSRRSRRATPG